jgi:hypothetical protein
MLRVRRSEGAIVGVLLVLLGIWGALIPFVGPYFHYAYTPNRTWDATGGRLWLEVAPGAVAFVSGFIVLWSRLRPLALLGAWLATVAGAWFAVGGAVAGHWTNLGSAGQPAGSGLRVALEQIGFFYGLGVVIVFLAAVSLGRFSVIRFGRAADRAEEPFLPDEEPEREPVGAGRGLSRIVPVPVFRGGRRADTAGS